MGNLMIFVSLALTFCSIAFAVNATNTPQNKSKRGVLDQTHFYGEPNPIKLIHSPTYPDSVSAAASSSTSPNNYYSNNPRPILFNGPPIQIKPDHEPPKQVTVQQVLYEYQQTPLNAVSNVHVNQFQTSPEQQQYLADAAHSPANIASPSHINPQFVNQHHILHVQPNQFSGVATPVQHGALIHHHGQGYPNKLLYGSVAPAVPTTSAPLTPANGPTKYIYANGKILYHPFPVHLHNTNTPYPGVVLPARPHNLVANQNLAQQKPPPVLQQKPFRPSPLIPVTYNKLQVHPQTFHGKPAEAPVKEEAEEEKDNEEKSEAREEQEEEAEEDDDRSNYEEEDEEEVVPAYYSKYRFQNEDDDEEQDRYRNRDEEEDEDSTRSHSRYVRKHPKKYARSESKPGGRYHKNDHYKFKEGFKTNKKFSSEFKSPNYFESSSKKPKGEFKSYKYYKSASNVKPKKVPSSSSLQGRESENVPVVHKHKVFHQEKWLVTKKDESKQ